jgi:hypothetical protein
MGDRALRHVVADAVPVEGGFTPDMQPFEAQLQQDEARVQGGRIVGTALDASRQALEPAGADVTL